MTLPVTYRPGSADDLNLVYSSWLKEYRRSKATRFIPDELYFTYQKNLIDHILQHSSATIICDPEDPKFIYGYIIFQYLNDHLLIHWMYIKNNFREFGLARDLITHLEPHAKTKTIYISHLSKILTQSANQHSPSYNPTKDLFKTYQLIHNPYSLYFQHHD